VVKTSSCRIIGGNWRGRKIKFDDADDLRPTIDRIRETVFNWLQPYLNKSVCLDLFAGSGVLGLEALSRGATEVVLVEKNKTTANNIKKNLSQLKASDAVVYTDDALNWLNASVKKQHFNLVFLDPPFHTDLLDAIIYVEHNASEKFIAPENWSCLKDKCAGQVSYKLFELL